MIRLLPEGATRAVGGIGRYQLDANVTAMAAGGHVRVGLEDNLHYDRERTELANNLRLVERVACIGREMRRPPPHPAKPAVSSDSPAGPALQGSLGVGYDAPDVATWWGAAPTIPS